jgi:hypothetical protein
MLAIHVPKIISIYHHLKAQKEAAESGGAIGAGRSTTYTGTSMEISETEGSSVEGRPQFYSDNVIRRSSNHNTTE